MKHVADTLRMFVHSLFGHAQSIINTFVHIVCAVYAPQVLWVHALMIAITALCVYLQIDWRYFLVMNEYAPRGFLLAADVAGFLVPLFFILTVVTSRVRFVAKRIQEDIYGIAYAICTAFSLALFYKALSGRSSPDAHALFNAVLPTNNSADFHLGFMDGEMLGGWPSSHTTIAFAMAAYMVARYPTKAYMPYLMYTYATLVGLGVAVGFHWLSEVLAGALLGVLIGRSVARATRVIEHS